MMQIFGKIIFLMNYYICKKSFPKERGGTHLKISNFHLFTNLKNNHFLGLKCLHTSIFICIISCYNIASTIFITIIISPIESKKTLFLLNYIPSTDFYHLETAFLPTPPLPNSNTNTMKGEKIKF